MTPTAPAALVTPAAQASSLRGAAQSASAALRHMLQLAAGSCPADFQKLDARCGLQYAVLGWVFVLNFVVLAAVWIKVGYTYWGPIGVLVPGVVVPAVFIFGIDRLVAMRPRKLTGELEPYSPLVGAQPRWEPYLRLGSAAALTLLTTLTFMVSQARPSIQRLQAEDARVANASLRAELSDRIEAQFQLLTSQAKSRQYAAALEQQRVQTQVEALQRQVDEVDRRARLSRDSAAMEVGGLGDRVAGRGPRFEAEAMIASQNEQSAMRLRAQLAQQSGSLPVIGRELVQARAVEAQALAQRMKDLADLDELVRIDPRYVAPLRGLFSDVSAFLRLFQDPREGPGQWLLAIVGGLVLFCLECIALLALALSPSSALDVMRQQRNRAMAAMIVAEAELSMAQSRARMANPPESASVPIEAAGTWRKGVSQP